MSKCQGRRDYAHGRDKCRRKATVRWGLGDRRYCAECADEFARHLMFDRPNWVNSQATFSGEYGYGYREDREWAFYWCQRR